MFPEMFTLLVSVTFFFQIFHWIVWLDLECLFFLFHFFCYFWQWWCLKLLKWFTAKWINFPHLQMCFPVAPKFLFPPLIWFPMRSSDILAGSIINADVTEFLKLQLVGINRNCKRIPLPHFAIFFTNYCPFKFCRRMGIWK